MNPAATWPIRPRIHKTNKIAAIVINIDNLLIINRINFTIEAGAMAVKYLTAMAVRPQKAGLNNHKLCKPDSL